MTEGVSAMHQTSMAWRHLHRKDDISPMAKTQGKKQLGKESNSNSQNWKRKCENKDWNHGIDTAYSGYREDYGEASLNETAAGEIGRAFGMNEGKGIEGIEEGNGKYEGG